MFSLLHCYYPLLPLLPIITRYQRGNLHMNLSAGAWCNRSVILMWSTFLLRYNQPGPWALEMSQGWPPFFQYFQQFKGNLRPDLKLQHHKIAVMTAHMCQASTGQAWATCQNSMCSNTMEVGCSCSDLELCPREITTAWYTGNFREFVFREHSNIKAHVSVQWQRQWHAKWVKGCTSFSTILDSNPCRLTHWHTATQPLSSMFVLI